MKSILQRIVEYKKIEISKSKKILSLRDIKNYAGFLPPKKNVFLKALMPRDTFHIIAEVKYKSPSKGILCKKFNPVKIASSYERSGASAISVLTDEHFFGGHASHLSQIKLATHTPILRKDFIVDEYQLYQSHLMGADAVLFIAAILSEKQMRAWSAIAKSMEMDVLYEVHNARELEVVNGLRPRIVGINNRDLKTFTIDLDQTAKLAPRVGKAAIIVSESGIHTPKDIAQVKSYGAQAVLVGEGLVKNQDPGRALRKLKDLKI